MAHQTHDVPVRNLCGVENDYDDDSIAPAKPENDTQCQFDTLKFV